MGACMPRGRALLECQVGDGVDQGSNNYRVMNVGVSHSEIMSDRILSVYFTSLAGTLGKFGSFVDARLAIELWECWTCYDDRIE